MEQEIYINHLESPLHDNNNEQFQYQLNQSEPQHYTYSTSLRTDTIPIEEKEIKYKNLPKLLGNNYCKYLKNKKVRLPAGAQALIQNREKQKQSQIKISDLKESCGDEESSQLFKNYLEKQLFLDLIFSNKIANCINYIPGISNYYAAASDPDKMRSNYILRGEFITKKVKMNDEQ